MATETNGLPTRGLKRIVIEQLFGRYDYDLPKEPNELSEVAIFYGDNGCGKTTILTLLFHLLSTARDRGHRTAISNVPFRRVDVQLHDGTTISATRKADIDARSYTLRITHPEQKTIQSNFDSSSDTPMKDRKFVEFISSLGLSLSLVAADRVVLSDDSPSPDTDEIIFESRRRRRGSAGDHIIQRLRQESLVHAIDSASKWISTRANVGMNVGSESTNEIYDKVVARIAESQVSDGELDPVDSNAIARTLHEISVRSEEYSKYDLTPPLRVTTLIKHLNEAEDQTQRIIARVLEPYVEGMKARLDALQETMRITEAFVRNFNEFFVDKHVSFGMSRGLQIVSDDGTRLSPTVLSSGEQQLLRLFCHTIVSRDRPSIFIIDEPELSLNIKWQRRLIDTLLELVKGSEMQFVFATHSLELIAQHQSNVVHLVPSRSSL